MLDLLGRNRWGLGSGLLVALVLSACSSLSSGATGSPGPSPSPQSTAAPSAATPSPSVSVAPSVVPEPTASVTVGATFDVDLLLATGRVVTIKVKDDSGLLVQAASGTPGDGASVPMNTINVVNDGPTALRLTWTGPPCATDSLLLIESGASRFTIVQPDCAGDSIPFDRVLILTFSISVTADSVEATLQAGGDTPG